MAAGAQVSTELERWLDGERRKTLGTLVDRFGEKSFAIVFVVLMAIPALPLPTGAVSHVLELVAMLLALQLLAGRRRMWLPARWADRELAGSSHSRFAGLLLKQVRWWERFSRPRLQGVFRHRLSGVGYGALVLALSLTAFLAPPFSGLDTLPALGVVVLSLGVVLEDFVVGVIGVVIGAAGVALVLAVGGLAFRLFGG
jgi:hypothetical protein